VYVALTDGRGKVKLRLRLIDADEEEAPIRELSGDVEFQDPRMIVEIDFAMTNLTFPAAGEYRLQLFAGTELLMERRVVLVQIPEQPQ
jgi:hypothetical protein